MPANLTSEGEPIIYVLIPADPGVHGNGIVAFVDNLGGTKGVYDDGIDDKIFDVEVDKDKSDGEFKVTFTLYDNIDNEARRQPDRCADEQILGLPVNFIIEDSDGTHVVGTSCSSASRTTFRSSAKRSRTTAASSSTSTHTTPTSSMTRRPACSRDSDDQSIFNPFVACSGIKLGNEVDKAGFEPAVRRQRRLADRRVPRPR